MLDKKQAAEYLQVTTRSLERYTNQGRISVRYEQSPNGEIAMFDPEELKNFKADQPKQTHSRTRAIGSDR